MTVNSKFGPFEIADRSSYSRSSESHSDNPIRRFDCRNYQICLNLSAALNWRSFTCKDCSGQISSQLLWRAQHHLRKDKALSSVCKLPIVTDSVESEELQNESS